VLARAREVESRDEVARWPRKQCRAGTGARKDMAEEALPDMHRTANTCVSLRRKDENEKEGIATGREPALSPF